MKKGRNSKKKEAPTNLADIRLLTLHTPKIANYNFPLRVF